MAQGGTGGHLADTMSGLLKREITNNMKVTLQLPTGDYAYVNTELEVESLAEAVEKHDELKALLEKEGHNQTDWARIRNKYALDNTIEVEDFEKCSRSQRYFINQMKLVHKSKE